VRPTPVTLFVGLVVAAPALWAALVRGSLPADVALQRLVTILLVICVVGSLVSGLVQAYVRVAAGAQRGSGVSDRRAAARREADSTPPAS
jgi:hypothetical protein